MSIVSVLTTVNAPYSKQLDEVTLAACLKSTAVAKTFPGHMSSFFGEVPPQAQIDFASAVGISEIELVAAARAFAAYSGETYPLPA